MTSRFVKIKSAAGKPSESILYVEYVSDCDEETLENIPDVRKTIKNKNRRYYEIPCKVDYNRGNAGIIMCPLCDQYCASAKLMRKHMETHIAREFSCDTCDIKFKSLQGLNSHKTLKHRSNGYSCNSCDASFATIATLMNHVHQYRTDVEKTFECDVCSASFYFPQQLKDHNVSHNSDDAYICKKCERVFLSIETLQKHQSSPCRNPALQCDVCGDFLPCPIMFSHHRNAHEGVWPLLCGWVGCDKSFPCKIDFNEHIKEHEMEEKQNRLTCKLCGKNFQTKTHFFEHVDRHHQNRKFHCQICQKSFITKSNLMDHIATHNEEKSHICPICNKGFNYPSHLATHMRCHSTNKNFSCEKCNKSFAHRYSLKEHMRTHSGETPLLCDACGKEFRSETTFATHQLFHRNNDIMKLCCPYCDMEFKKIQDGEANRSDEIVTFPCPCCWLVFRHPDPLKLHMARHPQHLTQADINDDLIKLRNDDIKGIVSSVWETCRMVPRYELETDATDSRCFPIAVIPGPVQTKDVMSTTVDIPPKRQPEPMVATQVKTAPADSEISITVETVPVPITKSAMIPANVPAKSISVGVPTVSTNSQTSPGSLIGKPKETRGELGKTEVVSLTAAKKMQPVPAMCSTEKTKRVIFIPPNSCQKVQNILISVPSSVSSAAKPIITSSSMGLPVTPASEGDTGKPRVFRLSKSSKGSGVILLPTSAVLGSGTQTVTSQAARPVIIQASQASSNTAITQPVIRPVIIQAPHTSNKTTVPQPATKPIILQASKPSTKTATPQIVTRPIILQEPKTSTKTITPPPTGTTRPIILQAPRTSSTKIVTPQPPSRPIILTAPQTNTKIAAVPSLPKPIILTASQTNTKIAAAPLLAKPIILTAPQTSTHIAAEPSLAKPIILKAPQTSTQIATEPSLAKPIILQASGTSVKTTTAQPETLPIILQQASSKTVTPQQESGNIIAQSHTTSTKSPKLGSKSISVRTYPPGTKNGTDGAIVHPVTMETTVTSPVSKSDIPDSASPAVTSRDPALQPITTETSPSCTKVGIPEFASQPGTIIETTSLSTKISTTECALRPVTMKNSPSGTNSHDASLQPVAKIGRASPGTDIDKPDITVQPVSANTSTVTKVGIPESASQTVIMIETTLPCAEFGKPNSTSQLVTIEATCTSPFDKPDTPDSASPAVKSRDSASHPVTMETSPSGTNPNSHDESRQPIAKTGRASPGTEIDKPDITIQPVSANTSTVTKVGIPESASQTVTTTDTTTSTDSPDVDLQIVSMETPQVKDKPGTPPSASQLTLSPNTNIGSSYAVATETTPPGTKTSNLHPALLSVTMKTSPPSTKIGTRDAAVRPVSMETTPPGTRTNTLHPALRPPAIGTTAPGGFRHYTPRPVILRTTQPDDKSDPYPVIVHWYAAEPVRNASTGSLKEPEARPAVHTREPATVPQCVVPPFSQQKTAASGRASILKKMLGDVDPHPIMTSLMRGGISEPGPLSHTPMKTLIAEKTPETTQSSLLGICPPTKCRAVVNSSVQDIPAPCAGYTVFPSVSPPRKQTTTTASTSNCLQDLFINVSINKGKANVEVVSPDKSSSQCSQGRTSDSVQDTNKKTSAELNMDDTPSGANAQKNAQKTNLVPAATAPSSETTILTSPASTNQREELTSRSLHLESDTEDEHILEFAGADDDAGSDTVSACSSTRFDAGSDTLSASSPTQIISPEEIPLKPMPLLKLISPSKPLDLSIKETQNTMSSITVSNVPTTSVCTSSDAVDDLTKRNYDDKGDTSFPTLRIMLSKLLEAKLGFSTEGKSLDKESPGYEEKQQQKVITDAGSRRLENTTSPIDSEVEVLGEMNAGCPDRDVSAPQVTSPDRDVSVPPVTAEKPPTQKCSVHTEPQSHEDQSPGDLLTQEDRDKEETGPKEITIDSSTPSGETHNPAPNHGYRMKFTEFNSGQDKEPGSGRITPHCELQIIDVRSVNLENPGEVVDFPHTTSEDDQTKADSVDVPETCEGSGSDNSQDTYEDSYSDDHNFTLSLDVNDDSDDAADEDGDGVNADDSNEANDAFDLNDDVSNDVERNTDNLSFKSVDNNVQILGVASIVPSGDVIISSYDVTQVDSSSDESDVIPVISTNLATSDIIDNIPKDMASNVSDGKESSPEEPIVMHNRKLDLEENNPEIRSDPGFSTVDIRDGTTQSKSLALMESVNKYVSKYREKQSAFPDLTQSAADTAVQERSNKLPGSEPRGGLCSMYAQLPCGDIRSRIQRLDQLINECKERKPTKGKGEPVAKIDTEKEVSCSTGEPSMSKLDLSLPGTAEESLEPGEIRLSRVKETMTTDSEVRIRIISPRATRGSGAEARTSPVSAVSESTASPQGLGSAPCTSSGIANKTGKEFNVKVLNPTIVTTETPPFSSVKLKSILKPVISDSLPDQEEPADGNDGCYGNLSDSDVDYSEDEEDEEEDEEEEGEIYDAEDCFSPEPPPTLSNLARKSLKRPRSASSSPVDSESAIRSQPPSPASHPPSPVVPASEEARKRQRVGDTESGVTALSSTSPVSVPQEPSAGYKSNTSTSRPDSSGDETPTVSTLVRKVPGRRVSGDGKKGSLAARKRSSNQLSQAVSYEFDGLVKRRKLEESDVVKDPLRPTSSTYTSNTSDLEEACTTSQISIVTPSSSVEIDTAQSSMSELKGGQHDREPNTSERVEKGDIDYNHKSINKSETEAHNSEAVPMMELKMECPDDAEGGEEGGGEVEVFYEEEGIRVRIGGKEIVYPIPNKSASPCSDSGVNESSPALPIGDLFNTKHSNFTSGEEMERLSQDNSAREDIIDIMN